MPVVYYNQGIMHRIVLLLNFSWILNPVPLNHQISDTVYKWLKQSGIIASRSYIKEQLTTHPEYPSLLAISDTLEELGIENIALQIDKSRLLEVPIPFLAHDTARAGFMVIDNIDKQVKAKPEFENNWNGTALLAEKPGNWKHNENENQLKREKTTANSILASILIITGLALLGFLQVFTWTLALLLIFSWAGIGIATLIVQHELGISTELGDKLCGAGSNNGCDAVMHSKGSRMGNWISPVTIGWADAGIIYFAAYSLLLLIALYTNNPITPLVLLSIAALPFTIFSLYYQWRVVKKWCRLCLLTVAVLWVQALFSLWQLNRELLKTILLKDILLTAFIFSIISAAWLLLVKSALQKNKQLLSENFSLQRFKNNPGIFKSLLKQQRRVDISPFENDLQLGNPEAAMQITVACNPYCGPCAKTHEVLHALAEKNDIGLTVRFTVKAADPEDKRTRAVQYMLQLLQGSNALQKRKLLKDWFEVMNYEKFIKKHPIPGHPPEVTEQLRQQEQWTKDTEIKFTPTIFINGRELPKQYQAKDLRFVIRQIEKTENSAVAGAVENNYIPA